jgi:hypothetical protein
MFRCSVASARRSATITGRSGVAPIPNPKFPFSARRDGIRPGLGDDTGVVDVANVTDGNQASAVPGEPIAAATPDEPQAAATPTEPPVAPTPSQQQRVWSMPKAPVTRTQADEIGRIALRAVKSIASGVAGVAGIVARTLTGLWRAIASVPPALQLFAVAGVAMLLGVVGSIALSGSLGLLCTVVVVPICSITLGALGHRWYSGLGNPSAPQGVQRAVEPATSDAQRSVEYVDKKLAVALSSLGTDRHQQAVIALFQAKTALELTLGTEQDSANYVDVPLPADDYALRPRIRVGSAAKSQMRESTSLAAS